MTAVAIFLIVNGLLDFVLFLKSRKFTDFVITSAGIVLGILILTGNIH